MVKSQYSKIGQSRFSKLRFWHKKYSKIILNGRRLKVVELSNSIWDLFLGLDSLFSANKYNEPNKKSISTEIGSGLVADFTVYKDFKTSLLVQNHSSIPNFENTKIYVPQEPHSNTDHDPANITAWSCIR